MKLLQTHSSTKNARLFGSPSHSGPIRSLTGEASNTPPPHHPTAPSPSSCGEEAVGQQQKSGPGELRLEPRASSKPRRTNEQLIPAARKIPITLSHTVSTRSAATKHLTSVPPSFSLSLFPNTPTPHSHTPHRRVPALGRGAITWPPSCRPSAAWRCERATTTTTTTTTNKPTRTDLGGGGGLAGGLLARRLLAARSGFGRRLLGRRRCAIRAAPTMSAAKQTDTQRESHRQPWPCCRPWPWPCSASACPCRRGRGPRPGPGTGARAVKEASKQAGSSTHRGLALRARALVHGGRGRRLARRWGEAPPLQPGAHSPLPWPWRRHGPSSPMPGPAPELQPAQRRLVTAQSPTPRQTQRGYLLLLGLGVASAHKAKTPTTATTTSCARRVHGQRGAIEDHPPPPPPPTLVLDLDLDAERFLLAGASACAAQRRSSAPAAQRSTRVARAPAWRGSSWGWRSCACPGRACRWPPSPGWGSSSCRSRPAWRTRTRTPR